MVRIMRSGTINLLLLVFLFTNLLHSFNAQPAPSPNSPSPAPNPTPPSPTPAPPVPTPTPSPSPNPNPTPPSPNAPKPAPPADGRGGPAGLSGGQKAGIVIGTLLGAALLGFFGMVCWKRQSNIRRNRYSNAARNIEL
ncbi:unnamed protein product [Trifolium pratense]|uniref:Uncharacterized protein n=1 Tax=Trifolium pratense TaxID=57577 RepID=A0ACB0J871_TRIPR|nr:unnamed protein product [Trifolium pratense]